MGKQHTHIRFWSGLRTIGGTIITVEHGQSRVIFDFGRCFSPVGILLEKGMAGLADPVAEFIQLGLLPPIDGLYAGESLRTAESRLRPAEDSGLQQQLVLISHLHLDHMALMGMVDPSIPVLMSADSLRLYEGLERIGEGVPRGPARSFGAFDEGPMICGTISVTPLRVDHDVPGACAFLVETPELRLLYTGDFRLHGLHPEWTLAMAEEARRRKAQVLVIEGTTVGLGEDTSEGSPGSGQEEAGPVSEASVAVRAETAMREASGLVVLNLYHRHIERLEALLSAAAAAGRIPVLEPETADLLRTMTGYSKDIAVLEQADGSVVQDGFKRVTYREINAAPKRFALQNSFAHSLKLLRLRTEGGVYIHSNGAPLGAYDPDYASLRDLLRRLGLEYRYIGASGHAAPWDLHQLGERIGAQWYIPLHSLHPEQLELSCGIRLLPEYGKTYSFHQGGWSVLHSFPE